MNVIAAPLRIVIPGGSGQVGQMLARRLQQRGHHVTVLTRGPYAAQWQTVHWDGEHIGPWTESLEGADVCINLAGRGVNCRYTAGNRADIYNSRINSTRLLGSVIAGLAEPPRVWLNASTATIYRHSMDRPGLDWPMNESNGELGGNESIGGRRRAPDTWNFSIRVAKDWETAFFETPTPRTRKIAMRSSILFSAISGNAFTIFSNLVRIGLGGRQGSGRQFVSWIHDSDFARAVDFLITREDLAGPINIASPNPLPNREFIAILREAWDVPNGMPIPTPLLAIGAFFLRTETELVLKSRRVIPTRLQNAGFQFEFPDWAAAAADLVQRWKNKD